MNSGRVAIIGAGSWGTALALLLAGKGIDTSLWGHRAEHVHALKEERENRAYLPGFLFPPLLRPTESMQDAVSEAEVICVVVPSHAYRQVITKIKDVAPEGAIFVSATKGIENQSLKTMTQVMADCLEENGIPPSSLGVLSGPSFAREVAGKVPTAITIGCKNTAIARFLQNLFSTDYFRVYTSTDIVGLEISAALKNIIAIAAGICDGLAFGSNARAALITRGLAEMTRLGVMMGARQETFFGLSGLGDLVLTCTGELSRNRYVGIELGKGKSLDEILDSMNMVAEGIKTTRSVYDLVNKLGADMPILEQVYEVLYRGKDCTTAVKDLLNRDLKPENE
ncbi:NAD(P)H-dependent glycerol-3-phosphate dehydrogenase [Thermodesulfobacteriota bacterium]